MHGFGRFGAAPSCLLGNGCQWATTLLRLLLLPDNHSSVPAWNYLQNEVLPSLVVGGGSSTNNYALFKPMHTLLSGLSQNRLAWGKFLHQWEMAHDAIGAEPSCALVLTLLRIGCGTSLEHPSMGHIVHRYLVRPVLNGTTNDPEAYEIDARMRDVLGRYPVPGLCDALVSSGFPTPRLTAWCLDLMEYGLCDGAEVHWNRPTWQAWWSASLTRKGARWHHQSSG